MRKDKNSIMKMLGSSNHSKEDREKLDFYATDPDSFDLFYDRFLADKETISDHVWECACGDGSLSKALAARGHNVFSTDLVQRKDQASWLLDYTKNTLMFCGDILTNPPYKHAQKFIETSLQSVRDGSKVIMFLRLQFLEGQKRSKLFKKYPPKYIYVHTSRQNTLKNNDPIYRTRSSAVCFAWFVWVKGTRTEPIIRWI